MKRAVYLYLILTTQIGIWAAADYSGQSGTYINFSGRQDLAQANFSGAHFTRGDFPGANLTGADFTGSSFTTTKFNGAQLSGAKFKNVQIIGADFTDADLTNADFSGARFTTINLCNAKGSPSGFSTTRTIKETTECQWLKDESLRRERFLQCSWENQASSPTKDKSCFRNQQSHQRIYVSKWEQKTGGKSVVNIYYNGPQIDKDETVCSTAIAAYGVSGVPAANEAKTLDQDAIRILMDEMMSTCN